MNLRKAKMQTVRICLSMLFLPFLLYISAPAVLSAVNAECALGQHQYAEISHIKATETQDGEIRYRCVICKHEYTEILFANDHLWGSWIIVNSPSCTEAGERYRTCTRGQTHKEYEEIAALGHNYTESVSAEASCENEGTKTFKCSRCSSDYTEAIPATGHEYFEKITKEPSCLEEGTKSFICKHNNLHAYTESITAFGAHEFGEWYIEAPAAEGVAGTQARICSRDGFKEILEIPALSEKSNTLNTADIILISANIVLIAVFVYLIRPYIRCIRYIKKRRKIVERLKKLRGMVEISYDFK